MGKHRVVSSSVYFHIVALLREVGTRACNMRVAMENASQSPRCKAHSGNMVFGFLGGFPGLITASSALTQLGETLVLAALASQKMCKRNRGKATFPVALCPLPSSHPNSQLYNLCFFYRTTRDTFTVALLQLISSRSLQTSTHAPLLDRFPLDASLYNTLSHHVFLRRRLRRRRRWIRRRRSRW